MFERMAADPNYDEVHANMKSLKQDVATRFNYVKIMVESIIDGNDVINGDQQYKKAYSEELLSTSELGRYVLLK